MTQHSLSRRLTQAGLALALSAGVLATYASSPAAADPTTDVKVNEINSNGTDFIELTNIGTVDVDLSSWVLADNSAKRFLVPSGTTLPAGGFVSFNVDDTTNPLGGFGLGNGDDARVFLPDGTTLVDAHTYPAHAATSWGRCPDGTGAFVQTDALTPGAANDCPLPPIKVNEINSNGTDFIELMNTGTAAVDLSSWVLADNSAKRFLIPAGTSVAGGGFVSFNVDDTTNPLGGFGLGNGDDARVFLPDGTTLVDAHTYPAHATTSWGRCPDGTGDFVQTTALTAGAANACPSSFDPSNVKLNEVESNGDVVADWVELTNIGSVPANVSGWKFKDAGASNPYVTIPDNTIIAPGAYYAIYTEFPPPGFGLGVDDTITLYQGDGTSKVDEYSWSGGHAATTYGRCPDGTGDWQVTTVATRGAANACSPIRVNEVSSSPDDWVELVNLSAAPVDVTGWVIKDSTDTNPATLSGSVPANGHLVVEGTLPGLGSADSVRLFDPSAKLIDSYSWTAHGVPTYARCADGVGAFTTSASATKGAVNDCPGLDTEPWFGSQDVATSDLAETFNQDASGVVFDPADPSGKTLWVAQNKLGTLWKMTKNGSTWEPATGWAGGKNPRYNDGTGAPDTEGITIGPDGAVYLAAERDNSVSGVSKNTVLRYVPGTSMSATDEWNLNGLLPTLGANLGLEGITWIPDSALTAGGFLDQAKGKVYDPADYPTHGTGLYAVAVEGTGKVYVVALEQTAAVQETAHLVATVDPELITNAGPAAAMDVAWDPEASLLRVLCDDSCDGTSVAMDLTDGAFAVTHAYDRPLGMPNLNNEGIAFAPQGSCVAGSKEVVWSDDGDTDGHSLRSGTVPCQAVDGGDPTEIQVLGTNDFHGRLIANGSEAGAAQFAAAVAQLRSENPNTVFTAAGDLIGASTFESFIQKDKPTLDVLNAAGLDVSAAGNHEFDGGYDDLRSRVMGAYDATTNPEGGANWQYIAANVRKKSDGSYALPDVTGRTPDAHDHSDGGTWTTTIDGVKVGFIGAVTEELPSLVSPGGIADLEVTSIIDETNAAADELKADGADLVILLVHEGAPDTSLASATSDANAFGRIVNGVDSDVSAIISGHTHLAYNHLIDGRPVVSAGQYGTNLNKLVFDVDPTTDQVTLKSSDIVPAATLAITAQSAIDTKAEVKTIVDNAVAKADVLGAVELGKLATPFNRAKLANGTTENRGGESTLGNVVAEAQRWATGSTEAGGAQIAFMNPGGLRQDMTGNPGGYPATLTYKQAAVVQPFANTLVNMKMTGAQVKTALEQQWQRDSAGNVPTRPFLRLGTSKGFTYTYDPTRAEGDRVTGMWLDGVALSSTTSYSVTVNSFLATGGDNFRVFAQGAQKRDTGKIDLQAMVDYMAEFASSTPLAADRTQHSVGVSLPNGDELPIGAQLRIKLSSLAYSTAADVKDTAVAVEFDGTPIGDFPVDNTIGTDVFDEYGTADVSFLVPDVAAGGTYDVTITGRTTGTTVTVPVVVAAPTKGDSTVTASVSPASIEAKTGTATVKVQVAAAGHTPTGIVTAIVDGNVVGGGELSGGKADIVVGPFAGAGTKAITLRYNGDAATLPGETSVSLTVTPTPAVEKATARVTTTVAPASVAVMSGRPTLSITVSKASGTPAGAVLALVDGTVVGAGELAGGTATIALPPFTSVGQKGVEVRYLGDDTTKPAAGTATVDVVKAVPTLEVDAPKKVDKGDKAEITVSVTADRVDPTGKVVVTVNGKDVVRRLKDGDRTIKVRLTKVGRTRVTVTYSGDGLTASASEQVVIKVRR